MEKVLCSPHYERSGWPQELLHWQPLLHCWQILSGFLSSHWKTLPHHQVEVICQLTLPGKDNHNLWKQIPLFMHWFAMMMYLSKLLYTEICGKQCNATVPSDSLGHVDFSVVLVEFVHHMPEWQVIFLRKFLTQIKKQQMHCKR